MIESHDEQASFAQALMSSGLSSQQLPVQAEAVANVSSSPKCLVSSSNPGIASDSKSLALVEQTENERLAAALAAAAKHPPAVFRKPVQADAGSHDDESAREYLRFMLAYRRAAETLGIASLSSFHPQANSAETSVPFDLLVAAREFCSPDEESATGDFKVVMPTHTHTHTVTHTYTQTHTCTCTCAHASEMHRCLQGNTPRFR